MKLIQAGAFATLIAMTCACWGGEYLQRTDTITLGAGNAKEVNAAIHTIDPWPPRVGDPRIPANGERMVGAINRYQGRPAQGTQGAQGAPATPVPYGTPAPGTQAPTSSTGAAVPSSTLPF